MLFRLFSLDSFTEILTDYVIALVCAFVFLYMLFSNKDLTKNIKRCLLRADVILIAFILVEIFERLYETLSYPTSSRLLLSCLSYGLKPYVAYCMVDIVSRSLSKRIRTLNMLPLLLNAILSIVAMFSDIYCYFDEVNTFHRGYLNFVPFVVGGLYLAELALIGIFRYKKKDWHEAAISVTLSIVVGGVVGIETVSSNRGLLPTTCIFGIIIFYAFFASSRYSFDKLTHAFKRTSFFADSELVNEPTFLCLFDIDDISSINNEKGHDEGDKAISNFANCISINLPKKAYLYRIGGDDFAVLYRTNNEKDISELINKVKKSVNEYNVEFSSGYAMFSSKDEFKKTFSLAEQALILNKHRKYRS